jgi:hypothetical protein
MTNCDLLKQLCKADPRWKEVHAGKGVAYAVCLFNGEEREASAFHPFKQLSAMEDGSITGDAALWSLLMEQIARFKELDAIGPDKISREESSELSALDDCAMERYTITPRAIIETQIAWSECRKQEVGS